MNNNTKRITRGIAEVCREAILVALDDNAASKEIMKGGGSNGGILTKILMSRPIENIRISTDALELCRKNNVFLYDYFFYGRDSEILKKKYGNFFSSNKKNIDDCHNVGHYITADHNIPNTCLINKMLDLAKNDIDNFTQEKIIKILNTQSLDFITIEENENLKNNNLNHNGTKEQRDKCCSEKIDLTDIWMTPEHIIEQFFISSGLNQKECLDPCACDGRWLKGKGISCDIVPMNNFVIKQDFLKIENIPQEIKYIVGNIPFSLMDEFVEKAFSLRGEAYFLVNGDTILKHFPKNIKKIWIINGIEGNQRDFRSRCEFDTITLKKSALWCCIVHLAKEQQEEFVVEKDITNEQKRDGFHVAIGRNTFIKSSVPVVENERIIRLQTKGTINYKRKKLLEALT